MKQPDLSPTTSLAFKTNRKSASSNAGGCLLILSTYGFPCCLKLKLQTTGRVVDSRMGIMLQPSALQWDTLWITTVIFSFNLTSFVSQLSPNFLSCLCGTVTVVSSYKMTENCHMSERKLLETTCLCLSFFH